MRASRVGPYTALPDASRLRGVIWVAPLFCSRRTQWRGGSTPTSTFTHEAAFRQEVRIAGVLIPIALVTAVSAAAKAIMIASVLPVLIVELLNSGIAAVTDRISLEHHALAKRAKDLGSAAVMLSLIDVPVVWAVALLAG
jgi:diacylglycerol kinase (ATP)